MFSRLLLAFIFSCVLGAHAFADDARSPRRYPLPRIGQLELTMPAEWKDQLRQPPSGLPPTITLAPATGNAFQVLITPLWAVRPGVVVPGNEEMRQMAARAADKARPQAVEQVIPVRDIVGATGRGYYFTATDKAPKPGEFKYLAQGIIRVGEIALMFTALTNDSSGAALSSTLDMLKGARHVAPQVP